MAKKAGKEDLGKAVIDYSIVTLVVSLKEDILVFKETPRITGNTLQDNREGAHELFSMFTADIMKEKVIFTR